MRRYEMNDAEWERISNYIPEKEVGTPGRPPKPAREVLNGILWIARSGAPWRDLPERFGPWETVYTRFRELLTNGILVKIFAKGGKVRKVKTMAEISYIKHLYENEGKSLREIARATGASFRTVQKYAYRINWSPERPPNIEPDAYPSVGAYIPVTRSVLLYGIFYILCFFVKPHNLLCHYYC